MEKLNDKVILVIRDGRGYRKDCELNAICQANTPNTDELMQKYPNILLNASGEAVGLPKGYQGNSEVGHMTIGSGRIILQSLSRINNEIKSGKFFENKALLDAINHVKKYGTNLHLMGLLQKEGVHAHYDHLISLLQLAQQNNVSKVFIHVFTDGRDAPVTKSEEYLAELLAVLKKIKIGKIVTITGRYYAMDRDKRRDRTKLAYEAIVNGEIDNNLCCQNFEEGKILDIIKEIHKNGEGDEFIKPRKEKNYKGIEENDAVIFWNFRTDRPRQLTQALVEDNFDGFERKKKKIFFVAMTEYYKGLNGEIAYPDIIPKNTLGEIISAHKIPQLRISETEKYAHVTFFFNGQREKPFELEDRILIPSPKVPTYDMKPEMSVFEIGKKLVENIKKGKYGLIITNLVNGDMVGHTGNFEAIKKAVEAVDKVIGEIVEEGLKHGYTILIFADHGNAEDQTPQRRTSHTTNPVPFIFVSNLGHCVELKKAGGLQDIAPTALDIMGIEKPKEVTGESLIKKIFDPDDFSCKWKL